MTVTVYHNGSGLLLIDHVAADLGLHAGQRVNDAQFWQAIAANAAAGIASCQLDMLVNDTPRPLTE